MVLGLEMSEDRHLPCITESIDIYEKNEISLETSIFTLALQPGALVNTSGRVQFSSPVFSYNMVHSDGPQTPC